MKIEPNTAIRLDVMTEVVHLPGPGLPPRYAYPVPARRYPGILDFAEAFDAALEPMRRVNYDLRFLFANGTKDAERVPVYLPEGYGQALDILVALLDEDRANRWTLAPPTRPGHYWTRKRGYAPDVVEVSESIDGDGGLVFYEYGFAVSVRTDEGFRRWSARPISIPEEPKP